jgi:thymidylate synthase (FAD)
MAPEDRPLIQKGKVGSYTFEPGTTDDYETMDAQTTFAYNQSWDAYQNMLKFGIAKEVARNVLPLGTMTQFYATANPRNVMQFLLLRNDKHALHEIREVAVKIEEEFAAAMPLTYKAFNDQRDTWEKLARLLELIDLDEFLSEIDPNKEIVLT